MPVVLYLLLCALYAANNAVKFRNLPQELISHNIFAALPIEDKIRSVSLLNKAGYKHYKQYHKDEINLFRQMLHQLTGHDDIFSYYKMENLTQQLRLSEIYSHHFPNILKIIFNHTSYEREWIFDAMNIHSMSISELNYTQNEVIFSNWTSELRILLLASRSLLHYYVPDDSVNIDSMNSVHILTFPGTNQQYIYFEEYPWIITKCVITKWAQYWAIYMSYLYEITFDLGYKTADIFNLDSIYKHSKLYENDDNRKLDNLQKLIDAGLIIWSRDNINNLRSEFFAEHGSEYTLFQFILEANRINKILFKNGSIDFEFATPFITKFILEIANKYAVNLSFNLTDNFEKHAVSEAMSIIEQYRFDNYMNGRHQSFEQLTRLMIKIGNMTKNKWFIMTYLAETEVNEGYIVATYNVAKRLMRRVEYPRFKQVLICMILQRGEVQYFDMENREGAVKEIRKLAGNVLFDSQTLALIVAKSDDEQFTSVMISELCTLRKDWLFEVALLKSHFPHTNRILLSMILYGTPM